MKRAVLLVVALTFLLFGMAWGQNSTVLTNFDHTIRDGVFGPPHSGSQIWDNYTWGSPVTTMWDTANGAQFEGEGALKVNWSCFATPSWGWYGSIWFHWDAFGDTATAFIDLSHRDTMKLRYKILAANPDTSVRYFSLILMLMDGGDLRSGGASDGEYWATRTNIRLDTITSEWQTVTVPLVDLGMQPESSSVGKGFVLAKQYGNGKLDWNKIIGWRFDISTTTMNDIGTAAGSMLFDKWECTGNINRPIDTTPPGPTQGVAVTATNGVPFSNTLSWTKTETAAKYMVYTNNKPMTDLSDPNMDVLGYALDSSFTSIDHELTAPIVDQEVTYYYNVVTLDQARNVGPFGTSVSRTATAKGIPTIADHAPASFFPDGDLSDWSGIKPTELFKEKGAAVEAGAVADSNDCSARVWLAMDSDFLYVAYDVTDEAVFLGTTDKDDCAELYMGMYNGHGLKHQGYELGEEPDYIIRFEQDQARIALWFLWDDMPILVSPGENYNFALKSSPASGYIVEAKISLDSLAAKYGDSRFHPVAGMRLPFGLSVNDRDVATAGERAGVLTTAEGNWDSPKVWKHTWIGDKMFVTSVAQDNNAPATFALMQNYPNPFNPATQIVYSLPNTVSVKLVVYDVLGRAVATLVNGNQAPGRHTVTFDGSKLASGMYVYRLQAGSFTDTRKMMVLK